MDNIALLSLNRAQKRNTLSEAMLASLSEIFSSIAADTRIRAVVILANGPAFSAGHDLKEITAHRKDADGGRAYVKDDMVSAEDAYRIGLVNRVVPAAKAGEEALKLARKVATKSALTVRIGKEAFYRQRELPLADAYKYAVEVMVENMMARDAEEGIGAFIEKRDPNWEHR
jgi:enoyl-CoA hydratase/carnithine racemase